MNIREQFLERMIKIYGYENDIVIDFAKMVENLDIPNYCLEALVERHEKYPCIEAEE